MAGTAECLETTPVANLCDAEIDDFACRIAEIVGRTPIDEFISYISGLLDDANSRKRREVAEGAD